MRALVTLAGLLGLALVVAACGGGAKTTTTTAAPAATAGAVSVALSEFKFEPATITVTKGQAITVTVKNNGATGHSFVVKDLNVNSGLADPGKSKSVTLTAGTAGTFRLICDVPGHEAAGMVGEVKVTE